MRYMWDGDNGAEYVRILQGNPAVLHLFAAMHEVGQNAEQIEAHFSAAIKAIDTLDASPEKVGRVRVTKHGYLGRPEGDTSLIMVGMMIHVGR